MPTQPLPVFDYCAAYLALMWSSSSGRREVASAPQASGRLDEVGRAPPAWDRQDEAGRSAGGLLRSTIRIGRCAIGMVGSQSSYDRWDQHSGSQRRCYCPMVCISSPGLIPRVSILAVARRERCRLDCAACCLRCDRIMRAEIAGLLTAAIEGLPRHSQTPATPCSGLRAADGSAVPEWARCAARSRPEVRAGWAEPLFRHYRH